MISRRGFLRTSTAVSGAVLAWTAPSRSAGHSAPGVGDRPRHIIHMVADGTSPGTLTCGDYLSLLLRERGMTWLGLYQEPRASFGLMNMRSLNAYVTDSSAAASSWGSGSRINNGVVNQLPDGTSLKTLYELLAEQGWKRGLVTTAEITHATPAGFVACVESRDHAEAIAQQYLARQVDLLLGGGQKFFAASERKDKRDLYEEYKRAGYAVMQTANELGRASLSERWLGTFASSHLPFTLDWQADAALQERVPTLATMTRRALDWLQRHEHFILQVEGGRVDHAAHNNDAAAALHDLIAFDEALEVVLAFQKEVPDTLIVVTTDHGTGGLSLNGMGGSYGDTNKLFKNLLQVKCSFPEMLRQMKEKPVGSADGGRDNSAKDGAPTVGRVAEVLLSTAGYKVSERGAELLRPYVNGQGKALFKGLESDMAGLGQLLANHLGIGWTGTAHTADFVPVLALGPGAERFQGFIQNVDVFQHYTQLAGIEFRNPQGQEVAGVHLPPAALENVAEYALLRA